MTLLERISLLIAEIGADIKGLKSPYKAVQLATGYPSSYRKVVTVIDAKCTPSSIITINWNEDGENSSEFDSLSFNPIAKSGSFDIVIRHCNNEPIGGSFNVNYKLN